jgi:hypothetical protein
VIAVFIMSRRKIKWKKFEPVVLSWKTDYKYSKSEIVKYIFDNPRNVMLHDLKSFAYNLQEWNNHYVPSLKTHSANSFVLSRYEIFLQWNHMSHAGRIFCAQHIACKEFLQKEPCQFDAPEKLIEGQNIWPVPLAEIQCIQHPRTNLKIDILDSKNNYERLM